MKVSPKYGAEIVSPDREDETSPRWPDDWLRLVIESSGGGSHALCGTCKKSFWAWMKESR